MGVKYAYVHKPGHGQADHMAPELIARAARQLGYEAAQADIMSACGFTQRTMPSGCPLVTLPIERGVRRRMLKALAEAKNEVSPRCRDTRIDVVVVAIP